MDILKIVAEDLREGNSVTIWAKGNSMFPLIRNQEDKISISSINPSQRISTGMIVFAATPPDKYLLHRIIQIDNSGKVYLRGDGNPKGFEIVSRESILGEAVCITRCSGKNISKGSVPWWCYQHLWPKTYWSRRIMLGILRRLGILKV